MNKSIVKQTFKDTSTVTKLVLIAKYAKENKRAEFSSLAYLLNKEYLLFCFKQLKKKKAAGIDQRTVESYTEIEIANTIEETIMKLKARTYQPQPVRMVEIPKEKGKIRTLGIPTVIDRVVQLGMAKILSSIFDSSFLPASFGYRKGKDAHSCLKEVNHMVMQQKVNYIIDADIKEFFDHIDHTWLTRCISERVSDPVFKRLIWKFLKGGVLNLGEYQETEEGTPQGGIISPILANIYLHYVLDLWMEGKETKRLKGYVKLIRYADDFIIGVQYKEEAHILLKDIGERLNKFGLTLSPEKTKIIEFGRFAKENQAKRGKSKPPTFDFLGFTHYCSNTLDGRYQVRSKTSRKKVKLAESALNTFLKANRHKQIWEILKAKLRGHYNYYGISGNYVAIRAYYTKTKLLVFKWLNRRSQKKSFIWEAYGRYLIRNPLPIPKLTYAIYNTW